MIEHIKTELNDGVLSITFARPDKKNALTALKKSPFITVEKALTTEEPKTDANVLGRPVAINIAVLSN